MVGPLGAVGLLVVVLVMLDFLATTISLRREGPMTRLVGRAVGGAMRSMPGGVASLAGPVALSLIAAAWIGGLWMGWSLVFIDAIAHLRGPEGTVVGPLDAVGFSGSLLSTLGLGVLTPTAAWVHVATVLASISGMVVLTLSVTYVLNVSQIATASRGMARRLDGLREACEELGGERDQAAFLLQVDTGLVSDAHELAERRESFRLADLYEREGSDGDVVRAAVQIIPRVERAATVTDGPVDRLRLRELASGLDRLTSVEG